MEAPTLFRVRNVLAEDDASDLRLTVDTAEDLALVRGLDAALDLASVPPAHASIAHLRAHPSSPRSTRTSSRSPGEPTPMRGHLETWARGLTE